MLSVGCSYYIPMTFCDELQYICSGDKVWYECHWAIPKKCQPRGKNFKVGLVYTQIHHFEAKQMKVHIPQFLTQYHKQVTRYGCFYVIAIATDYDRSFMLF